GTGGIEVWAVAPELQGFGTARDLDMIRACAVYERLDLGVGRLFEPHGASAIVVRTARTDVRREVIREIGTELHCAEISWGGNTILSHASVATARPAGSA